MWSCLFTELWSFYYVSMCIIILYELNWVGFPVTFAKPENREWIKYQLLWVKYFLLWQKKLCWWTVSPSFLHLPVSSYQAHVYLSSAAYWVHFLLDIGNPLCSTPWPHIYYFIWTITLAFQERIPVSHFLLLQTGFFLGKRWRLDTLLL